MAAPMELLDFALQNEDFDLVFHLLLDGAPDRQPTYDPEWPRFALDNYTDDQAWNYFRFFPEDIRNLVRELNLPPRFRVSNGCVASGLDVLCMVLRRFVYPNRLVELEPFFGRPFTTISMFVNEMVDFLFEQHQQRLKLDNPWMDQHHLQLYADTIADKGAPLDNVIGFIDGTVRPICRPTRYQRVCYNGHKRIHAIKFQSIVIPNGLIAHLYGPMEGRRHDCALLAASGLMAEMEHLPMDRLGRKFAVYGDPAYPIRTYLLSPFGGANLNVAQMEFNRRMSSVRECVEWEFGNILRLFAFLDFRKDLKVLLSPVAKYYMVGALLTNCHTCLYGNQTSTYFGLDPPSLQEYLH